MSEFNEGRARKLIHLLKESGINAVLFFPGADIGFYTGFSIGPSERPAAALIPVEGKPVFIVNELEGELRGMTPWFTDRIIWTEDGNPYESIAEAIKSIDLSSSAIGLTSDAPWGWVQRISTLLPEAKFVDASAKIGKVRMIKAPEEIGSIRKACAIADESLGLCLARLRTGITEAELSSLLAAEMKRLGGEQSFQTVLFGERAALPHGQPGSRALAVGDAILVDMGCTQQGYWSDLTRTAFYGEPSSEHIRIYETVRRANEAAFQAVRPDAVCGSVDEAGRSIIRGAGYADYFIHRLGHGIGIQIHEEPYIVKGNQLKLEAGMVFSDEPGIYVVGDVGVRIEDTVVCTPVGCERLTRFKRDLSVYPVKA